MMSTTLHIQFLIINNKMARYSQLWRVIYLSLIFFAYQSVANSVMGIMSQITSQNNIQWAGPVTTMLLFFFSGVGSLYTGYLSRIRYNYTFYIGSFGYVIYVASTVVFTLVSKQRSVFIFIGTCLINIVGGLIVSALYNSQWNYISECSTKDNASMYFGINMGVIQASNIFGNLLSEQIVEVLGQTNYCIVMTVLIVSISLLFLLVKEVKQRREETQVVINTREQIQESQITEELTSTVAEIESPPSSNRELYKILPSFYCSGTIIAFIYTFISIFMSNTFSDNLSPVELNNLTFKILMLQGAGEFLGGLFFILFSDKYSKKLILLIANKLFVLVIILVMVSYYLKSIYVLGVAVVIVGFVDCCSFSLNLAIISQEGWSSFAYSLFNLGQCMGVVISILVLMWAKTETYLIYAFGIQLIASFLLHNFKPRDKAVRMERL